MFETCFIIILYFIILLILAFIFSRKQSLQDYFINNKSSGIWILTFSNVATLMWAGAAVTAIGEMYNTGISFWISGTISIFFGAFVMAFFAPKIFAFWEKYGIYSIVDFFEKRFGKKAQMLSLVLQLILLIVWTAAQIAAIWYLVNAITGISYLWSLFIAMGITITYSAVWWLKVDLITDFLQFWIILLVFITMGILGYLDIWSVSNLVIQLDPSYFNMFAFWGVWFFFWTAIFGALIYLSNSIHWQRILSAKSGSVARKSFLLATPFIGIISLIIVFLGLSSAYLLSNITKEMAIFELIQYLFQSPWLIGIAYASILAVIMSSVDSLLVWGSTIIWSIWKKIFKTNDNKLNIAKIGTFSFWILSLVLAIFVPQMITLTLLLVYLALIFVPAIIGWLYSKKISENAVFYSLLIPSIILLIGYLFDKENIFLFTTIISILIVCFYDMIFESKS